VKNIYLMVEDKYDKIIHNLNHKLLNQMSIIYQKYLQYLYFQIVINILVKHLCHFYINFQKIKFYIKFKSNPIYDFLTD
jgi:hypothetical protein